MIVDAGRADAYAITFTNKAAQEMRTRIFEAGEKYLGNTQGLDIEKLNSLMKPENFIGCATEQTTEYLSTVVAEILKDNQNVLG